MARKHWCDSAKRWVPRRRGRRGSSRRLGTSMGKATIARMTRASEKSVRQTSRRLCRERGESE
jgi:hypothetical protein